MKFIIVFAGLAIFVANTQAQTTTTEGAPSPGGPGEVTTAAPVSPVSPVGPVGPGATSPSPGVTGTCRGQIRPANCLGNRAEGTGGNACRNNANPRMWYYNRQQQSCQPMAYRGCGGNRNRYCTRAACDQQCTRRGGGA